MMDNKGYGMEETQKKMMELLVSRTLRKHGVKKGKSDLSEKEKEQLKSTIELLRKQVNQFTGKTTVTEEDVDPITNVYKEESEVEAEQPKPPRINRLAQRRKNRRLE